MLLLLLLSLQLALEFVGGSMLFRFETRISILIFLITLDLLLSHKIIDTWVRVVENTCNLINNQDFISLLRIIMLVEILKNFLLFGWWCYLNALSSIIIISVIRRSSSWSRLPRVVVIGESVSILFLWDMFLFLA